MNRTPNGATSQNEVQKQPPYPQIVTESGVFNIPHCLVPAFSNTGCGMKVIQPNASAS